MDTTVLREKLSQEVARVAWAPLASHNERDHLWLVQGLEFAARVTGIILEDFYVEYFVQLMGNKVYLLERVRCYARILIAFNDDYEQMTWREDTQSEYHASLESIRHQFQAEYPAATKIIKGLPQQEKTVQCNDGRVLPHIQKCSMRRAKLFDDDTGIEVESPRSTAVRFKLPMDADVDDPIPMAAPSETGTSACGSKMMYDMRYVDLGEFDRATVERRSREGGAPNPE